MADVGNLQVVLTLQDKMTAGLKKAGNSVSSFAKKHEKAALISSAAVIGIGAALSKMAMDAVESENLFEVSMGNMSESARNWSEELSSTLGLNSYEIRKNVGTLNVMMGSMGIAEDQAYDMAKGLTQLTNDMASFYNLKPEIAFQKLQAGISGETEPLKRLGILINETTIKTWALTNGMIEEGEQLTEAQKVMARYAVIMEQTSLAQGDLARTMESPTNQLRILQSRVTELAIEVGMKLLPIVSKLLTLGLKLFDWFEKQSPATKKLMGIMAGLTAIVVILAGPVLTLINLFVILLPAIKFIALILTGPVGIVVAIGAAIVAIIAIGQKLGWWKKIWQGLKDWITVFKHWFELGMQSIGDKLLWLLGPVGAIIYAIRHWDEIKEIAGRVWTAIKDMVSQVGDKIKGFVSDAINWGKDFIGNFIKGIIDGWTSKIHYIIDIWNQVKGLFSHDEIKNDMRAQRWGSDFINNFSKGMQLASPTLNFANTGGTAAGPRANMINVQITTGDLHSSVDVDNLAKTVSKKIAENMAYTNVI